MSRIKRSLQQCDLKKIAARHHTNTRNMSEQQPPPSSSAPAKGISFSLGAKKAPSSALPFAKPSFVDHSEDRVDSSNKQRFISSLTEQDLQREHKDTQELVIPLIVANQWRTKHLPNNAEDSEDDEDAVAKKAAAKQAAALASVSGDSIEHQAALALMSEAMGLDQKESENKPDIEAIPLLLRNAVPGLHRITDDDAQLAYDVDVRPDAPSVDDYDDVPVEAFGAAMLRGMGWSEGAPVGLTNKAVNKPISVSQRDGRQGLGAAHGRFDTKKKAKQFIKPGEKRADPINIIPLKAFQMRIDALVSVVATTSPHFGLYARVTAFTDDSVTFRLQLNGTEVGPIPRSHVQVHDQNALPKDHPAFFTGERAAQAKQQQLQEVARQEAASAQVAASLSLPTPMEVVDESPAPSAASAAASNDEHASKHRSSSHERPSSKEKHEKHHRRSRSRSRSPHSSSRHSHKHKHHKSRSRSRDRSRSRSRERSHKHSDKHDKHKSSKHDRDPERHSELSLKYGNSSTSSSTSSSSRPAGLVWVSAGLTVRIVNPSIARGSVYNKKGRVEDIVSPTEFTVLMDDTRQIIERTIDQSVDSKVCVFFSSILLIFDQVCVNLMWRRRCRKSAVAFGSSLEPIAARLAL
jgi:hypothetical protein